MTYIHHSYLPIFCNKKKKNPGNFSTELSKKDKIQKGFSDIRGNRSVNPPEWTRGCGPFRYEISMYFL